MDGRYQLFGDRDGQHEFNIFSNDRADLVQRAQHFIKKGYFVFLIDQKTGNMKEIK